MTLKEGKNNHTYVVGKIEIELNLERRLEALGHADDSPHPACQSVLWHIVIV